MDLTDRTNKVLGLIKDQGKSIRSLEKELGYSNGAFKVRDGKMSSRALNKLEEYFGLVEAQREEVLPAGDHEEIRRWGNGRPGFRDHVPRFRDVYEVEGCQNNGLWKRYHDWCTYKDKEGKRVPRKGWEVLTEKKEDSTGEYYLAKNGVKIYITYK